MIVIALAAVAAFFALASFGFVVAHWAHSQSYATRELPSMDIIWWQDFGESRGIHIVHGDGQRFDGTGSVWFGSGGVAVGSRLVALIEQYNMITLGDMRHLHAHTPRGFKKIGSFYEVTLLYGAVWRQTSDDWCRWRLMWAPPGALHESQVNIDRDLDRLLEDFLANKMANEFDSLEWVWWRETSSHEFEIHLANGETWRGKFGWRSFPGGVHCTETKNWEKLRDRLDAYRQQIEWRTEAAIGKRYDRVVSRAQQLANPTASAEGQLANAKAMQGKT